MIGVFDSGSGGLTVLKEIVNKCPKLDVVYFGDLKNIPYGNKSQEELQTLTAKAIKILKDNGARGIVSACNSVSATIIESLSNNFSIDAIDVVEMIGPTTKALRKYKDSSIVVVGTNATISSGIYQKEAEKLGYILNGVAIPPLAGAIEESAGKEKIRKIIEDSIPEISNFNPDIVVLCCTQFPFVKEIFEKIFDEGGLSVEVINPASFVAEESKERFVGRENGTLSFLISSDSDFFREQVGKLFPEHKYNIHILDNE